MPLFNCICGDFGCGGILIDVDVHGDRVEWLIAPAGRRLTFSRQAMYESLQSVLGAITD